jgi:hypothetical protein
VDYVVDVNVLVLSARRPAVLHAHHVAAGVTCMRCDDTQPVTAHLHEWGHRRCTHLLVGQLLMCG